MEIFTDTLIGRMFSVSSIYIPSFHQVLVVFSMVLLVVSVFVWPDYIKQESEWMWDGKDNIYAIDIEMDYRMIIFLLNGIGNV